MKDREKAQEALEKFRELKALEQQAREIEKTIEKPPEIEAATPSAVEELRLKAKLSGVEGRDLNDAQITFVLPMARSWTKKKKVAMNGIHHEQKPDLDNLCKSVFDVMYPDDSGIHTINARKIWGQDGKIIFQFPA